MQVGIITITALASLTALVGASPVPTAGLAARTTQVHAVAGAGAMANREPEPEPQPQPQPICRIGCT